MNLKKRNIIVTFTIFLVAVMTMGSTLAYFSDEQTVTNTFTMGDLDITLTETWDPDDGEEMVPGDSVDKKPIVTADKGDSFMRVTVTIMDKNDGVAAGTKVTDAARLAKIMQTLYFDPGTTIVTGTHYSTTQIAAWPATVLNGYNSNKFTQHSATGGVYVYYYKDSTTTPANIFKQGTSATLFTHVVIPSNWTQTDIATLGKYDVVVKAEAVQCGGFANDAAAFTALDAQIAATP